MSLHKPLDFIENKLIFLPLSGPKLSGQRIGKFILPFQREVITSALDKEGNPKQNIFMGYSRKISKSMIFSWIFNYLLECKEGIQLVNMASTFSQSGIIFNLIKQQIELNPDINAKDYRIILELIENTKKHSKLQKIYSQAGSNLGILNCSGLIADEIGAMQSRENLSTILSGMSMAQTKPLLLFASNPPEHDSHWSNEYLKSLSKDKEWKFLDYSADIKSDPYSVKAKSQANPFYKHYTKTKDPLYKNLKDFIDKEADRAKQSAENLIVYRRFQLGQRVSAKAYQWVDIKDIKIASDKVLKEKLRPVMGFDLALSRDFCSAVLALFNEKTEDIYLKPFLHLANTKTRRPSQRLLFQNWNQAGYITIQDRDAIDKTLFNFEIKKFLRDNKIEPEQYVWDRNLSTGWTDDFSSDPLLIKGTGFELSHAIRWLEARSKEGKLHIIGKNPALLWMFDCVICSPKSKNYVLLDRPSRRYSIDGAVCAVLCAKYFIENREPSFEGFAI